MTKTELLAPAGELNSVYGAFAAGADAVYLGAPSFSARAYAQNLSCEEIIEALDYAHHFGKKIYLTLNTLLKDDEINKAIDMLIPLYKKGLDGIIIQDFSLIGIIHNVFPALPIHASTQMSVMSHGGVRFLKNMGVTRIVPSRELSVKEIAEIKKEGLEIECFIHGAMCYSYSGKCLFSSFAGGRSGNRGRCAGPCRKEYDTYIGGVKVNGKNQRYPLSMRDMCTVKNIDELIKIGVDSFKIEGRMKAPEYSAGVSSVYRRVIDDYIKKGKNTATEADVKLLGELYVRSGASTGYLYQRNGKDMICFDSPAYQGINDAKAKEIKNKYIDYRFSKSVNFICEAIIGNKLKLTAVCDGYSCCVYGDVIEKALNKGTQKEDFIKQLKKTGGTIYVIDNIDFNCDNDIFVRLSDINNLRRKALEEIDNAILKKYERPFALTIDEIDYENNSGLLLNKSDTNDYSSVESDAQKELSNENIYIIGVKNNTQFSVISKYNFYNGIIFDMYPVFAKVNNFTRGNADSDFNELSGADKCTHLFDYDIELIENIRAGGKKIFLRLPYVIRENDYKNIESHLKQLISNIQFDGVYVGSYDGLFLALEYFPGNMIIADDGLYVYNRVSKKNLLNFVANFTESYELSFKEIEILDCEKEGEFVCYGYLPLMYSAGCIYKNFKKCDKYSHDSVIIKDEDNREFKVLVNHALCLNTIYNYVPLNLINNISYFSKTGKIRRLEFTVEDEFDTEKVMNTYQKYVQVGFISKSENNTFTYGAYKRGIL